MLWLAALAVCWNASCGPAEAPEAAACERPPTRELAAIVAGETSVVPAARLAVACTALADWRDGVPLEARWYGRQEPREADVAAVELALGGACGRYPRFRFVGSGDDWQTWRRMGYVTGDPPWRWERDGWVVVATP